MTEELKIYISAEIGKLKQELNKGKTEIKNLEKETADARKKIDDNFKKLGDGIGKAFSTGCKVAAGALATVAAGATALTKSAIGGFAEYEQLVGGVGKLFAETEEDMANDLKHFTKAEIEAAKASGDWWTAEQEVLANAQKAYKTAGMNANKYMETVTSFSAALIKSTGNNTMEAAMIADTAITDMADNANTFGSSMESIQNAYQGFAKQNYTMLDNLKLGYGGTQEEMERLLKDAEKFSGIKYDISSLSDVYNAIHVIQTEMGVAGATAAEASKTISGSWASTKAAWDNLVTGLANGNADIPKLVANVVASAGDVLANVIPAIKSVIQNIPIAISEISPEAGAAFQAVSDAIMAVLPILKDALSTIFDVIVATINFVSENTGVITAAAIAIGVITTAIGLYNVVAAVKAAMAAAEVTSVWALVAAYAAQAAAMVVAIAPYVLIAAAIAAVIAIIVLCIKHWDDIKEAVSKAMKAIWNFVKEGFDKVKGFFEGIINFVKENWQGLLLFIVNPFAGAFKLLYDNCEGFREMINNLIEKIKGFFSGMWDGLKNGAKNAWEGVKSVFSNITGWFKDKFTAAWTAVKNVFSAGGKIFDGIKDGIVSVFKTVVNAIIRGINKVVSVPFDAINGVLKKLKGIEVLGVKPFKWVTTFSVPKIPELAKGGIVDSATLAVVGERGKEAIMPLENNTEWIDTLAAKINGSNGNVEPTPIILNVDGKIFAQTSIRTINDLTKQTGSLQLNLV